MKDEHRSSSLANDDTQEPPLKRVKHEVVEKEDDDCITDANRKEVKCESPQPVSAAEHAPDIASNEASAGRDASPTEVAASNASSSSGPASADDIATAAAALSAAMTSVSSTANGHVNLNISNQQFSAQIAQVAAAVANNNSHYQQLFAHFDPNALAMAASVSAGTSNAGASQAGAAPQVTTEMLKRELINQKVRADNRERKKRWREQNEERNKDNDLRCRVNKRAHRLFGKDDSDHKQRWIEEEFSKRQSKRKEKERRKQVVNGVIGASGSGAPDNHAVPGMDLAAQQDQLTSQHLHDPNFLAKLLSSAGAGDSSNHLAKEFLQLFLHPPASTELNTQTLDPASSFSSSSSSTASETEKLAALLKSAVEAASSHTEGKGTDNTDVSHQPADPEGHSNLENGEQLSQFPLDAVMTLMQLNAGWKK